MLSLCKYFNLIFYRYYINYKLMKKRVKQYAHQIEVGTLDRRHVLKDFSRMLDNQVLWKMHLKVFASVFHWILRPKVWIIGLLWKDCYKHTYMIILYFGNLFSFPLFFIDSDFYLVLLLSICIAFHHSWHVKGKSVGFDSIGVRKECKFVHGEISVI